MKILLSCVILAKNEEKNIRRAIESVKFCDETIVIDDESTDITATIAKQAGATVYQRQLHDNFASQRSFGLNHAKGEWILFVDADEYVSQALSQEIQRVIKENTQKEIGGYYIARRDVFWGRQLRYGETGNLQLIRLVRQNSGQWVGKVHETFTPLKHVAILKHHLIHHPHETIKEFLSEINRYSTLKAAELYAKGTHASLFSIIVYPLAKFKLNYFLKLGFLDGVEGFVYALMMSFHSFLVRAKLYMRHHA